MRKCDYPGCEESGEYKAPKDRKSRPSPSGISKGKRRREILHQKCIKKDISLTSLFFLNYFFILKIFLQGFSLP